MALALVGFGSGSASCTKNTTPPVVEPTATEPEPPPILGDTSAAYAGHEDGEDAPTKRERPEPRPVEDRDAALDAVTHSNPQGAIDFLSDHLGKKPDDTDARLALARAQIMVGQLAEATATLADGAGTPDAPRVLRRRAQLAWRRGRAKDARALLHNSKPVLLPVPFSLTVSGLHRSGPGVPAAAVAGAIFWET